MPCVSFHTQLDSQLPNKRATLFCKKAITAIPFHTIVVSEAVSPWSFLKSKEFAFRQICVWAVHKYHVVEMRNSFITPF